MSKLIKEGDKHLKVSLCISSEAVGSYAENQRITAVRRVYQRGCVNPMINIEQLWRDYSKYEEVRVKACVILVQDTLLGERQLSIDNVHHVLSLVCHK